MVQINYLLDDLYCRKSDVNPYYVDGTIGLNRVHEPESDR